MADSKLVPFDELILLDNLLGRFYGKAAAEYIRQLEMRRVRIDLIASHGQTVRHLPAKTDWLGARVNGTSQIGSADFVSAATGKVVISDFRQADVAVGNEGAPITVAAMHEIFAAIDESRLLVNLGGMSNYFYFPAGKISGKVRAEDCGPGNCLSDILSESLFGERFDRKGRRARRGTYSMRLLSVLLANPFFAGRAVSTGREVFGPKLAGEIRAFGKRFRLPGEDLLATAIELTVTAIVRKVAPIMNRDHRLTKLYLTGGGRHNIFLKDRLQDHLPDLEVCMIDELGINGDFIEAAAFAVMGEACLRSRALDTVFGGRKTAVRPVLGKISQPPYVKP